MMDSKLSILFLVLQTVLSVLAINSTGLTDTVQWDPKSLFLFGQRTFILSAEVHPWRNVNPSLWRDIFEKIKDNGFNTVSFYDHWGLHYPFAGINNDEGDFTSGTYRDTQMFIDEAKRAGLWLIARPGPYVNGETSGGGIPGWASNNAGGLRTNAADYTAAWKPYITSMAKLIAKNQITNGGPIILVQSENEFSQAASHNSYMQEIMDTYRANGVVIPFTHNDQHSGQTGNFSPDTDTTPNMGAVNIYCGDSYPQGSSSWAQVQAIYRSAHVAVAPSNPLCLAEFGGGFLINWGGSPMGGTGYEKFTNTLDNADYENVFYKDTYAQTATILNIYMLFGGTNWGSTVEPTVYSSYDYGGGINENRVLTPKMAEMRLQGLFLRVSRDLLGSTYIGNGTNYTTSQDLFTQELRNSDTGAGFYFVRHNSSPSTVVTTSQLNVTTSFGTLLIPQTSGTALTIQGREQKIIVTDYVFGISNTRVLYSTAEVMTWTTVGTTDYIIVYAMSGQQGETSLILPGTSQSPKISTTSNVGSRIQNSTIILNYTLSGSNFVTITSQNKKVVVMILDKDAAKTWHAPSLSGSGTFGNFFSVGTNSTALVSGPYLIREAAVQADTLNLQGDLNGTTTIEFVPPPNVKHLSWNGQALTVTATNHGTLITTVKNGLLAPVLPALAQWKVIGGVPETGASFDDSSFVTATQTTTNYTSLPPLTPGPVLYSQQYGFFGGIQLYRGHFNASSADAVTAVNLTVQGGFAFAYSAWINGVFLGSAQGNVTTSLTTNIWAVPNGTIVAEEDNVLTVVMDHMGLVETSTNSGKEPRGIRGVALIGSGNTSFTEWKIQGNLGGNTANPDTFRGYLNEGGLFPIRIGAHLPGFDDSTWTDATELGVKGAGINFFRTTFSLALPGDTSDVPIRLAFTPSAVTENYRVQIFINGWMFGEYINNIGPQTIFALPSGILRRNSPNTLALAVWSLDQTGATVSVSLVDDGAFAASHSFADWTDAPDYDAQKSLRPSPAVVATM